MSRPANMTPLTKAQQQLVIDAGPLIGWIIKRTVFKACQYEDLYDAALDAVIRAARTFDPTKAAWSTYATHAIKAAMMEGKRVRKQGEHKVYKYAVGEARTMMTKDGPIPMPRRGKGWNDRTWHDTPHEKREEISNLYNAIKQLPFEERRIVEMTYAVGGGNPMTPAQIGRRMNLSSARVAERVEFALEKLKWLMEDAR